MHNQRHLLIRHAHRPKFAPGDWGNEVSITSEGKAGIEHLGRSLFNSYPTKIFTSPVKRCMETALELRRVFQREIPVVSSTLLGGPGFLVSHLPQAETVFKQHSINQITHLLLSGQTPPGFYPFKVGCAKMLCAILDEKGTSSLSISHDLNIAILGCWLFNTSEYQAMIPDFLEGIEFEFNCRNIVITYRGFKMATDETSLRGKIDSQLSPAQ